MKINMNLYVKTQEKTYQQCLEYHNTPWLLLHNLCFSVLGVYVFGAFSDVLGIVVV